MLMIVAITVWIIIIIIAVIFCYMLLCHTLQCLGHEFISLLLRSMSILFTKLYICVCLCINV